MFNNPLLVTDYPLLDLGAHVAQSVEHFLGKEEVTGSIPVMGFVKKGYSHF